VRHNCNVTTRQVVRYVRHRLGPDGVVALLAAAGEQRPVEVLEDLTEWSSYDEGRRLFEAAAVLLGGAHALHEAGRHVDRTDGNPELLALLRSLGSPSELLRFITETAAKFSTVVAMEAVEIGDDHGIVAARSVPGFPRYPELCEFTAGLLAQSPDMFGHEAATVEETKCETRGDDHCLFVLQWGSEQASSSRRLEHLEEVAEALTARFEALSSTVGDLLSGADVDCVLDRIVQSAARAIRAPGYVLAVRLDDGAPLRVHHVGLDHDADELAHHLIDATEPSSGVSCLVAEVASARRHYGRLAAVNPPGVRFLPDEHSVLTAYAKLSAAALDSAAALEESRSQAALAHTLLDLANQLANATGREQTAQWLANAVPEVVGCDVASVVTYDRTKEEMTFAAFAGFAPDVVQVLDGFTIAATDTPWFGEIVASPRPLFFDRSTDDAYVLAMLELCQITSTIIVPIVGAGTLFGVVNAGVRSGALVPSADLLERLAGLADQAATAFRNAELVDVIREQAFHDPLTGTPNRRLFEDRAEVALAAARRSFRQVAVLFLDLDGFKNVNDRFGHGVGDELLRAVSTRLSDSLRGSDTIARVGGDEFAILLPSIGALDEVETVIAKLHTVLEEPFAIDGVEMAVSASIGAAISQTDGNDCRALLRRADSRMYEVKLRGRAAAG